VAKAELLDEHALHGILGIPGVFEQLFKIAPASRWFDLLPQSQGGGHVSRVRQLTEGLGLVCGPLRGLVASLVSALRRWIWWRL